MNFNLYRKELKRNNKNLLIWMSIVIGFTIMVLAIFPYMAEMGESLAMMLDKIPAELAKAMGMDAQTWSSILGFYSTYYGVYIIVLVSIFTTSTATVILSKEERDRTAEFLLTRPVSRLAVYTSKIASLLTLSVAVFAVQTIIAIIFIHLFKTNDIDWNLFSRLQFGGFFLMLLFTSIGVFLSMVISPKKNLMGLVVGITFGTYILNALGKSTEATEWLSYLSPFNYFDLSISNPGAPLQYFAAFTVLIICAVLLVISYKVYSKKDIAS